MSNEREPPRTPTGVFFSVSSQGDPPLYDADNQAFRNRLRCVLEDERSPAEKIQTFLQLGTDRFDVENGHLAEINPVTGTHEIVEVSGSHPDIRPGAVSDLATTYGRRIVGGREGLAVSNASEEGWQDDPAYQKFGFHTYLGGTVTVGEELYGTVCFVDREPRDAPFTEEDAAALELIIRTIGQELERRRQTDPLQQTTARLEAVFEGSPDMNFIHDTDGTIITPNPRLAEVTGYSDEELAQLKVWDLDRELTADEARERWETMESGDWQSRETEYRCKDGTTVPVQVDVHCMDVHGAPRFVTTGRDISKRKEREEETKRMYRQLQVVLNTVDAAIFIKDLDGRYQLVNDRCRELLGIDEEEDPLGHTDYDFFSDDIADHFRSDDRRAVEEQETIRIEETVPTRSGPKVYLTLKSPLTDENGEPIGVCAVSTDITERKEKERELSRLKTFNQELVRNAPVGLVHLDEDLRITYENPRAEEIFGIPEEKEHSEAIGVDIRKFPSVVDAGVADKFNRLLEGEEISLDLEFHSIYGQDAHLRGRCVPLYRGDEFEGAVVMIEDVSEQKERERALRDRQKKVESLYGATDRLLRARSREEGTEQLHDVLERVFDYPVTGICTADEDALTIDVTVSETHRVSLPKRHSLDEKSPLTRAYHSGETVVADVGSGNDQFNYGNLQSIAAVPIGTHGVVLVGQAEEVEFASFDLRLIEIVTTYASLVLDRLGREEDLVEAKHEAERMNRMKTAFLANMSHEIRTPLTSIIGFAEVIGEESDQKKNRVSRFSALIEESGRRLLDTLDAVLNLSKLEAGEVELEREPVNLRSVVTDTAELRRLEVEGKGLELHLDLPDTPVKGWWNRDALDRIIANLLDNAIKFTPEDGKVHIRLWKEPDDVVLEIEDTGIGIEEEIRPHIFEAFKQESEGLRREYEGTGLGLSIVRSMVELLEGDIEVESVPNAGTCFTIRLPRTDTPQSVE